ncbi:MAG TPA: xanthine dehydrogenase family protein molybdopterin-binding subunit [Desulfobacteraceae bacterium]|nr:xanthine dehydrogenase family protein molybdopterin-binding subunit [Desulfobacteraceae bacterium]HPJ66947.1 xanthine dehydrogenase family protein molybdopterin-binding subunit [Desulfobacteraceae bacterium]HPQ27683.1 xanthine dehydrogenase family protein molybdopterin-binding subunit [Desulfobacteraceae bacterium]
MNDFKYVTKGLKRTDGELIVTGKAQYTVDISLPGMLFGKILGSPYSHAKIKKINIDRAKELEGVKAVVTGEDIGYRRFSFIDTPAYPADQTPLAVDKVRFVGEGVAAVAAVSEEIATKALELIEVEYEELTPVFDPEESMKEGSPQVHDIIEPNTTTAWEDFGVPKTKSRPYKVINNISNRTLIQYGDIEKGFEEADYIREDRFEIPSTSHVAMEPHVAVADYQPTGKLDVWLTHMGYEHKRLWLAKLLDIPISRVRVHKTYVGGTFGGKISLFAFEFITAYLSRLTLRPVKITLTRQEVFSVCPPARRMIVYMKMGVKNDGKIIAYHSRVIDDVGAYRRSSPTALYLAHSFRNPIYDIPNVKHEGYGVYTNKLYATAKRGHSLQQMSFAVESQIDMICEHLALDKVEMRLKNFRKKGDILPNGDTLNSYALPECLLEAAEKIAWKEKYGKIKFRGLGIGTASMFSGAHNYPFASGAMLRLNHDGRMILYTGQTEFGIGIDTVMAQVVAEVLNCPMDYVIVNAGDSEISPHDIGNWLSAGMFVSGEAVRRAALDLREQMLKYASAGLEINIEDLDMSEGWIVSRSDETKKLSFSDISRYGIQMADGDPLIGKGYTKCVPEVYFWNGQYNKTASLSSGRGRFTQAYGLAVATAEVEVDPGTGEVKIIELVVADDCGTPINRKSVEGQIMSQAVMAIGDALFEEIQFKNGVVMNPNLLEYRVPTANDIPKITSIIVDSYEPNGPFGAKEVGETSRAAVISAIANAICNATGKRIYMLPMTGDKVMQSIGDNS